MQIMTGRRHCRGLVLRGPVGRPAGRRTSTPASDAKGRRLTADRPIAECIDREQKKLSPSGTVKAKIGPALTAQERAAEEAKAQKAMDERRRLADEKKRDRALLARYPDQASHDKERAIGHRRWQDEVIAAAQQACRRTAGANASGWTSSWSSTSKDPSRMPPTLAAPDRRKRQRTWRRRSASWRTRNCEKKRINARFDEELAMLKRLWAPPGGRAPSPRQAAPAAANPAAAKP